MSKIAYKELFMFIILLKFSENKALASEYMAGHNEWIAQGFQDGIFLLVGSLKAGSGGAVLAHNTSSSALAAFVDADPFVKHNVVVAEILEIEPKKVDARLNLLFGSQ
jgi:uncharacterized protein YciI